MNRKLLNGLLVLAVATGGVGTFTSCKDEDFRNKVLVEEASLEAQIQAIRDLSDAEFEAALDKWLNDKTQTVKNGTDPQFKTYEELVAAVATMKNLYDDIMAGRITGDAAKFADNLWNYLYGSKLQGILNTLQKGLEDKIAANTVRISALETALANQGKTLEDLTKRMTAAEGKITSLETALGLLQVDVNQLKEDYASLLEQVTANTTAIEGLAGRLGTLEGIVADLQEELGELAGVVDGLGEDLATLSEALDTLAEEFAAYQKKVDSILDNLLERASSVGVSQTFNPVFGTINLPIGLSTKVLATYEYKSKEGSYSFPADAIGHQAEYSPLNLAGNNSEWSTIIAAIAGSNTEDLPEGVDFTAAQEFGNMGGAVVTINPFNVDFTDASKYTVSLVNSMNEEVLAGGLSLDYNTHLLKWGVSRADQTGVYELSANATPDNYSGVKFDLEDKSDLKTTIKNAINDKSIADFAKVGKAVFDAMNNQLEAYAVKVAWTETSEETDDNGLTIANETENYVLSDFDLAAVVAHPLSYDTNIGKYIPSGHSLRQISPLAEYLDRIGNKLNISFDDIETVDDITLEFTFTGNGTIKAELLDANGNPTGQYIEIAYGEDGLHMGDEGYEDSLNYFVDELLKQMGDQTEAQVNKVIKNINDAIGGINDQLKDFEGKVEDAKEMIDRIKDSALLTYADKLVEVYNKVATRINNFLASPNSYMQVMMAYNSMNGETHLSTDWNYPVTYNTAGVSDPGFKIYATSYTGDVVTPSYKKWVAITQVDGNYQYNGIDAMNAASEDLNTVVSGTKQAFGIKVTDAMKGHKLTITYASVDYRGKTSIQNYYVVVK